MTEYWVSKKQYWCKYCSGWIRDDAPSRRQHETGLKHQGNMERYIRELYKGGSQARREKEQEASEMARIESSAAAAFANDRIANPSLKASQPKSAAPRVREVKDKFANYSTAQQLGFDDEETQKSSYEVEQELKGRAGEPGGWETVEGEPSGAYTPPIEGESSKRKLGEYVLKEEEDQESWRLQHREKRTRDPYDDDDYDPKTALKGLKVRVKEETVVGDPPPETLLQRENWSGKIELGKAKEKPLLVYNGDGGGWVKEETAEEESVKEEPAEPLVQSTVQPDSTSAFKKRRPPPSSRKK